MSASCWTGKKSTSFALPPSNTGTPWARSGPARPASTSTWKSRPRTTSGKAGRWSTPRGSYQRIVQCGTQQRSNNGTRAAIDWIRAGNLGKIKLITAFANKPRVSVGKRNQPLPIPPEVDYDLWCGPAKKLPIYRNNLQYDCSFDWNTGDGESANQGVHEIDVARWLLGETELPRRVMSIGGRFVFNDAADCPNTQIIYYDFPTAPVLYEVHNLRAAKDSKKVPEFRRHAGGRGGRLRGRVRAHQPAAAERPSISRATRSRPSPAGAITSSTSSRPSAAAAAKSCTPKSWKDIFPPASVTPATSPTGWAGRPPRTRFAR